MAKIKTPKKTIKEGSNHAEEMKKEIKNLWKEYNNQLKEGKICNGSKTKQHK